jgi:cupin 2 domain-containing protein
VDDSRGGVAAIIMSKALPYASETPMLPRVANLFQAPAAGPPGEQLIALLQAPQLRLEQIISRGQSTADGCWYDQADPEWVLLVRGAATLQFEAGAGLKLKAGDFLLIPAHMKHRVECCSDDALWLALHYGECLPGSNASRFSPATHN